MWYKRHWQASLAPKADKKKQRRNKPANRVNEMTGTYTKNKCNKVLKPKRQVVRVFFINVGILNKHVS